VSNDAAALAVGLVGLVLAYAASQSATVVEFLERTTNRDISDSNDAVGGSVDQISEWADRTSDLSDAVDDAVRNEERYAGVPVSPYQ